MSTMENDIAIGIDLGTTNCCVAVYYNNEVIVIPNHVFDNSKTTPSYVAIKKDHSVIAGSPAKDKAYKNLETTIYDAKRMIGRDFSDPILQHDMTFWPFKVEEHEGKPKIQVHGRHYRPEEISAKLLLEMVDIAQAHLPLSVSKITKAVITVPAYFNDCQRQATMEAGRLAGLEVLCILNEPTAAAMAYFHQRLDTSSKKVLIFDFGGGTLDVAVIEILSDSITVLGIHGDTHLGGQDFDQNLMLYCVKKFKSKTGIDLLKGKNAYDKVKRDQVLKNMRRLQTACEKTKRDLSGKARSADVDIEGLVKGKDLSVEISQQTFESLNAQLFEKCIKVVDEALTGANVSKGDIDDIILIGGSTRINKIRTMLQEYFDKEATNVSINSDEAVAYGAAVQGAILTDKWDRHFELKCVQDVTPMSLGVLDGLNGNFRIIIPKNSKIPVKKWQAANAVSDNQRNSSISVYQGEEKTVNKNTFLGHFTLTGFAMVNKDEHICDVVFEVNHCGILHVTAISIDSKNKAKLTVVANNQRPKNRNSNIVLQRKNSSIWKFVV